jgi:hypothetical protein
VEASPNKERLDTILTKITLSMVMVRVMVRDMARAAITMLAHLHLYMPVQQVLELLLPTMTNTTSVVVPLVPHPVLTYNACGKD